LSSRLFYEDIVTVRIGKKGLTSNILEEIKRSLKAHGVVKIKLLRSFRESQKPDRHLFAKELAERVNADLVGIRGYTFILRERRKEK